MESAAAFVCGRMFRLLDRASPVHVPHALPGRANTALAAPARSAAVKGCYGTRKPRLRSVRNVHPGQASAMRWYSSWSTPPKPARRSDGTVAPFASPVLATSLIRMCVELMRMREVARTGMFLNQFLNACHKLRIFQCARVR